MATPTTDDGIPFVDEHAVTIASPPGDVWPALVHVADRMTGDIVGEPVARLLGCVPASAQGPRPLALGSTIPGFRVTALEPERELRLEGRHRFSRYALILRIEALGSACSRVRAETRAVFPGPLGRAYRALVIGTRGHVVAVHRILHAVERRATRGGVSS